MVFQYLADMHKMHGSRALTPLGAGVPIGPRSGEWRLDKTRPGGVYAPDFQPLDSVT